MNKHQTKSNCKRQNPFDQLSKKMKKNGGEKKETLPMLYISKKSRKC
jgi:hypothetical protein